MASNQMLSDEKIRQFQLLWENRFGKKISREKAYEEGSKLCRLLELIFTPMNKKEYSQLQKRRKETVNSKKTNGK